MPAGRTLRVISFNAAVNLPQAIDQIRHGQSVWSARVIQAGIAGNRLTAVGGCGIDAAVLQAQVFLTVGSKPGFAPDLIH